MRRLYALVVGLARRFFRATNIPVPASLRRANMRLRRTVGADRRDLNADVDALARAVERLEAEVYLQRFDSREEA